MEEGKEEQEEEDDDNESKRMEQKLDIQHYIGSNLVKQHSLLRPCHSVQGSSNRTEPTEDHQLRHQARVLTGMPLINFNSRIPVANREKSTGFLLRRQMSLPNQMYTPQQIAILQHHHLNYIMAIHQQQLQYHYQQQQQEVVYQEKMSSEAMLFEATCDNTNSPFAANEDMFGARVIKPNRKKKQILTRTGQSLREHPMTGLTDEIEIDFEDEKHFLPTNLLSDTDPGKLSDSDKSESITMSDKDDDNDEHDNMSMDAQEEDDSSSSAISPIRPPSRALRQTESLRLEQEVSLGETEDSCSVQQEDAKENSHHCQLRKTFSWANSLSGRQQDFSLFPQTSESDLLSSIRNNLANLNDIDQHYHRKPEEEERSGSQKDNMQTRKNFDIRNSHLEEALKSLNLESNDAFISRKF